MDEDELVERVARAIYGHRFEWDHPKSGVYSLDDMFKEPYRIKAIAAIAAVRAFDAERGMVLVPDYLRSARRGNRNAVPEMRRDGFRGRPGSRGLSGQASGAQAMTRIDWHRAARLALLVLSAAIAIGLIWLAVEAFR